MTEYLNTLSFVRKAKKDRDIPAEGLIYIHRWSTGAQQLVFRDRTHAEEWCAAETHDGRPTRIQHD